MMLKVALLSSTHIFFHMKLACKDLNPATTCDFEVEGASANDAAVQMLAHARVEHAADIDGMADGDVIAAFEAKVRP